MNLPIFRPRKLLGERRDNVIDAVPLIPVRAHHRRPARRRFLRAAWRVLWGMLVVTVLCLSVALAAYTVGFEAGRVSVTRRAKP